MPMTSVVNIKLIGLQEIVLIALFIGYISAAPQKGKDADAPIISQESEINPDGSYHYK